MKTERIPWHLLAGLILGLGLGLLISWIIAPVKYTDTPPSLLRSDFKDAYRALIASAYTTTGDIERAEERLATLGDADPLEALAMQAQRTVAEGDTYQTDALAVLATDLGQEISFREVTPTSTRFLTQTPGPTPTKTPSPINGDDTNTTPEPPDPTLTPVPISTRTPASTSTTIPTVGAPYILIAQDEICSTNISEGLLMIYVTDSAQRPLPGVEIIVEWQQQEEEHFFTGLKPELGHGYADFAMEPAQVYALHLATGSTAVGDLSSPPCQDKEGNHYWGSLRLRFQRP